MSTKHPARRIADRKAIERKPKKPARRIADRARPPAQEENAELEALESGDWRSLPPAAKKRLLWLLQTQFPKHREEQRTPKEHALCKQHAIKCEKAVQNAAALDLSGEDWVNYVNSMGHIPWLAWYIEAGRGFGKTRCGAEDVAKYGRENAGSRIALVGATFSDVRDTMVEGESGLLSVLDPSELKGGSQDTAWNRSIGELWLANGTRYKAFSGEKPDGLRGPQHHRAWCDEMAAWKYMQETWDQVMFGLRLGQCPQVVITTTPRPKGLLRDIRKRPTTITTKGSTFDNKANLAPTAMAELRKRYEGTRLGRQELMGEFLEDVPGALWQRAVIDRNRIAPGAGPLKLVRIVIALDPAVTSTEESDEFGIVIAGIDANGIGYVLKDATMIMATPADWSKEAVKLYWLYEADRIVAEVNNGGEMIEHTLRTVDPNVSYKAVHASRGKRTRAEPVSALYEQNKVKHVGIFNSLEDQMCEWVPDEDPESPDRMDALVWCLTELMIKPQELKATKQGGKDLRHAGRR